jgi:5'-nucleotidase
MRTLLCNDDGIHAPGIVALYDALAGLTTPTPHSVPEHSTPRSAAARPIGDLLVVAPLTVQSATGHGITFREPLMTKTVDVNERMAGVAVDGRPADCVKLALCELWPQRFGPATRPDLVVSGMNMGANVGINVLYSGTVAAAIEAAFLGVPAIAVSLHHGTSRPRYDVAARHARAVIDRLLARGPLAPHTCINVNIPITERDGPTPPIALCPMNTHAVQDAFTRNTSPMGDVYYWSSGKPLAFHATEPGSDVDELFAGKITVTPLSFDMTCTKTLAALAPL